MFFQMNIYIYIYTKHIELAKLSHVHDDPTYDFRYN